MSGIRAFLALEIPPSHRDQLRESRRRLEEALSGARWVPVKNQHLTVKFLGEVQPATMTGLVASLRSKVGCPVRIVVQLEGGGFFPNRKRPRVAWIGGRAEGVDEVVRAVEDAAFDCGFSREQRPWSLHLTQARMKAPWTTTAVDRYLDWAQCLSFEPFDCDRLILYSSDLRPSGAVYTAVDEVLLQ